MTASAAMIGYGTTVHVETSAGSGTYTKLGEVTSVTPPNESVDEVEVTHMESPNRYKEYVQGLIDPGDISVEINYIPGDATDDFIVAWRTSGETRNMKFTYPNAAGVTFPAFVKGYQPSIGGPSGKMSATLTCKVAGEVTPF